MKKYLFLFFVFCLIVIAGLVAMILMRHRTPRPEQYSSGAQSEGLSFTQPRDTLCLQYYDADGVKAPDNYFFNALSIKDVLVLTAVQEEKLLAQGWLLPQLLQEALDRNETSFSSRLYENQKLVEILTESQYDHFLLIRNQSTALKIIYDYWRELQAYRLIPLDYTPTDSARICNRLFQYQLARSVVNDRFRGDKNHMREAHAVMDLNKPDELVRLEVAKKTLHLSPSTQATTPHYTSTEQSGYRGTFRW